MMTPESSSFYDHFKSWFESNYDAFSSSMSVPQRFFVYTSNVDGLFRRSNIPSSEVIEIHGNACCLQCTRGVACNRGNEPDVWPLPLPFMGGDEASLSRCSVCKRICRPYVLMFNDEEWLGLENKGPSDFDLYDVWEEGMEEVITQYISYL